MSKVKEEYRKELIQTILTNVKDTGTIPIIQNFEETLETLSIDELELLASECQMS